MERVGKGHYEKVTENLARDAIFYAALVVGYFFLSTGLATLRYGDEFLPPRIRRLHQIEGWPGHELDPQGWRRIVGVAFGLALLAVDVIGLIGVIVTAAANSDPVVIVYVLEFTIAIVWTTLLWRWLIRHQRATTSPSQRLG